MNNQAIRTVGTGLIITGWLFAATKDPRSKEYACIGLGLFIAGSAWPVVEKVNGQILRGVGIALKEVWKFIVHLYQRNRITQKEG
jgi:hypothetical protein